MEMARGGREREREDKEIKVRLKEVGRERGRE